MDVLIWDLTTNIIEIARNELIRECNESSNQINDPYAGMIRCYLS